MPCGTGERAGERKQEARRGEIGKDRREERKLNKRVMLKEEIIKTKKEFLVYR